MTAEVTSLPQPRPHRLIWLAVGCVALVLVATLSLSLGNRTLEAQTFWRAFTQFDPSLADHVVLR